MFIEYNKRMQFFSPLQKNYTYLVESVGEHIHVVFVQTGVTRDLQDAVLRRQSVDQQLGEGNALIVRHGNLFVHTNALDNLHKSKNTERIGQE